MNLTFRCELPIPAITVHFAAAIKEPSHIVLAIRDFGVLHQRLSSTPIRNNAKSVLIGDLQAYFPPMLPRLHWLFFEASIVSDKTKLTLAIDTSDPFVLMQENTNLIEVPSNVFRHDPSLKISTLPFIEPRILYQMITRNFCTLGDITNAASDGIEFANLILGSSDHVAMMHHIRSLLSKHKILNGEPLLKELLRYYDFKAFILQHDFKDINVFVKIYDFAKKALTLPVVFLSFDDLRQTFLPLHVVSVPAMGRANLLSASLVPPRPGSSSETAPMQAHPSNPMRPHPLCDKSNISSSPLHRARVHVSTPSSHVPTEWTLSNAAPTSSNISGPITFTLTMPGWCGQSFDTTVRISNVATFSEEGASKRARHE